MSDDFLIRVGGDLYINPMQIETSFYSDDPAYTEIKLTFEGGRIESYSDQTAVDIKNALDSLVAVDMSTKKHA